MEFTNKQDARPGPEDLRKILGEQSCTCDFAIDWIEVGKFVSYTYI